MLFTDAELEMLIEALTAHHEHKVQAFELGQESYALLQRIEAAYNDLRHQQWIIVVGDPIDGFTFDGPFETHDEALQLAETGRSYTGTWWIAPLDGSGKL
jgi:hypothetical protein